MRTTPSSTPSASPLIPLGARVVYVPIVILVPVPVAAVPAARVIDADCTERPEAA